VEVRIVAGICLGSRRCGVPHQTPASSSTADDVRLFTVIDARSPFD
jgi:hypothetical protein